MTKQSNDESVVKQGGVADESSNTGDVTRDTYGDAQPTGVKQNKDERLAEADRAAAAVGIPGVAVPEPETASRAADAQAQDQQDQDEELREMDVSGDRVASRRDVEKLKSERP